MEHLVVKAKQGECVDLRNEASMLERTTVLFRAPAVSNQGSKAALNIKDILHSRPDFFIVGAQKCGTTSLYRYLAKHPCVLPASKKEIDFFADNYDKGYSWYLSHYPSIAQKIVQAIAIRHRVITGEATPYYMFHPHAPARIRQLFPQARIIVMLRNPVDRAYSHYRYHVKLGAERLSFEQAIEAEARRLHGEMDRMIRDEYYSSPSYKNFSYLKRGIYIDQVRRWFELYPREQVQVIASEDFFADPESAFGDVQDFLDLPRHTLPSYRKFNTGGEADIGPQTRAWLEQYFRDYNRQLYDYLGTDFGWDG